MRVPALFPFLLAAAPVLAQSASDPGSTPTAAPGSALPAFARPVPAGRALPGPASGHGGPVRALALSADGGALASGGFDERLLARRPPDGASRAAARAHGGGVLALAALPGGGWASGGEDGRVALWPDPPGAAPARVLAEDGAAIAALATRGERLLAAGRDGTVRAWDLRADAGAPGQRDDARSLGRHDGPATAAAFRADGTPVTGGADGMLRAWRDDGTAAVLLAADAPVLALLALPDGGLAAAIADGRLLLVGLDGPARELSAGGRPIPALAASADGRLLLAGSLGGSATLWSLSDRRLRATLESNGAPAWSVALSPDGAVAWTGGADGRVLRWDAATGRALDGAPRDGLPEDGRGEVADARGARVFRACAACHALRPESSPMAGPHLAGLLGRRMGGLDGYAYSPRLARGDILWTPDSVADLFTRGPAVVVPGTRMPDQRVSDPEDMAALLRFLAEAAP